MYFNINDISEKMSVFEQILVDFSSEKGIKSFFRKNHNQLEKDGIVILADSEEFEMTPEFYYVCIELVGDYDDYIFKVSYGVGEDGLDDYAMIHYEDFDADWAGKYDNFENALKAFFKGCEEINFLIEEKVNKHKNTTQELFSKYMNQPNITANNRAVGLDEKIINAKQTSNKQNNMSQHEVKSQEK